MTRTLAVILLGSAAAGAVLGLFQITNQVQGLERNLKGEYRAILESQEAIHALEAEWSYLNRPERIADLAVRHLKMGPLSAEQIVPLADMALRLTPTAKEQLTQAQPAPADSATEINPTLASARAVR